LILSEGQMKMAEDEPLSLVLVGGSSGSFLIFGEILKLLINPLPFALVFILHRGKSSSAALPELFKNKPAYT
jgi:two-component system chemotaxis response regulator CheB